MRMWWERNSNPLLVGMLLIPSNYLPVCCHEASTWLEFLCFFRVVIHTATVLFKCSFPSVLIFLFSFLVCSYILHHMYPWLTRTTFSASSLFSSACQDLFFPEQILKLTLVMLNWIYAWDTCQKTNLGCICSEFQEEL